MIPAALGAVAGAIVSVVAGAPNAGGGDAWSLLPPEVAGMRLAFRTGWPPALAVIGTLPVLAARTAARNATPAASAALAAGAWRTDPVRARVRLAADAEPYSRMVEGANGVGEPWLNQFWS